MIKSGLLRAWLSVVFLTCFHGLAAAQTFELSLDQGRVAARQAALSGQFELARDFALALTEADENDRIALLVLAAVQPKLGEARAGRRAGTRAFRLSQTDAERYEAARLVALAAANEERFTLSQYWLRRAAINAPNERALQQTQTDYRGIRNLNPWSVNLGFSVTPSSNVNGGSKSEFNVIDGVIGFGRLSPDAQALSGIAASGDVRLSYTVSRDADQLTRLTARAYARTVWLSNEAQNSAPASRNSDFGSQVLEFSVDHRRRVGDGTLSANALIGAAWFGGDLNTGYLRAGLDYGTNIAERTRLTFGGDIEQTYDPSPWTPNNQRGTLTTALTHVLQSGDRVNATLSFDAQSSDNLNERYEILTAQVSYAWADPFGPVQLSITGGAAFSHYRDYSLPTISGGGIVIVQVPGGRSDTRLFSSITATFPELDYAGFVPVMTFGFQDTQSNVSRFERDEYSVNIGVRSSF